MSKNDADRDEPPAAKEAAAARSLTEKRSRGWASRVHSFAQSMIEKSKKWLKRPSFASIGARVLSRDALHLGGKLLILGPLAFFCLVFHGAVPFWGTPTLWQVIWSMGFAESMANSSIFTIHSTHFGLPGPTPAPFGLSGIWPASILIRLGMHPADAYSFVVGTFALIAFFSCYRIARILGASFFISAAAAVVWLTLPFHHLHAQLSFVAVGMMLLPFYLCGPLLFYLGRDFSCRLAIFYLSCGVISVFMDGYSFVMFATGASVFIGLRLIESARAKSWRAVCILSGLHAAVFTVSFALYVTYLSGFDIGTTYNMVLTRSNGMDFSALFVPGKGQFALFDYLEWSEPRSHRFYFNGAAATTPFALPLLAMAVYGGWSGRKVAAMIGFGLCALVAFYFAAGPEFKYFARVPEDAGPGVNYMQRGMGLFPTGNEWIYEYVPGFKSIRYPYRWAALGLFSLWLIAVAGLATRRNAIEQVVAIACLLLSVGIVFPKLDKKMTYYETYRDRVFEIDADLISTTIGTTEPHERVFLLPTGTDDLANYWAPRAGFRTFNVGGDKNTLVAQSRWNPLLRGFKQTYFTKEGVISALLLEHVDVVFLHYMDLRLASKVWTCRTDYSKCPQTREEKLAPLVAQLSDMPFLEVSREKYFTSVRLNSAYDEKDIWSKAIGLPIPHSVIETSNSYSVFLHNADNCDLYSLERPGVIQSGCNDLRQEIVVPKRCTETACELDLAAEFQLSNEKSVELSITAVLRPKARTTETWPQIIDDTVLVEEARRYEQKIHFEPSDLTSTGTILLRIGMNTSDGGTMLTDLQRFELR